MKLGIQILKDYTLQLPKSTTFNDLLEFIRSKPIPDIENYIQDFIIGEIIDANPDNYQIAKNFEQLLGEGSKEKLYDFYISNKLYNPNDKNSKEDLRVWYHIKFI